MKCSVEIQKVPILKLTINWILAVINRIKTVMIQI